MTEITNINNDYFCALPDGPIFEIYTHIFKNIMTEYTQKFLSIFYSYDMDVMRKESISAAVNFILSSKFLYEKYIKFKEYYKEKLYIILIYREQNEENIIEHWLLHKNHIYDVTSIIIFDTSEEALSHIIKKKWNHLFIEHLCFGLFDIISGGDTLPEQYGKITFEFPDNFPTDGGSITDSEDDDRQYDISDGEDILPEYYNNKPKDVRIMAGFQHKRNPETNKYLPCGAAFFYYFGTANNYDQECDFLYLEIHRKKSHSFINIIYNSGDTDYLTLARRCKTKGKKEFEAAADFNILPVLRPKNNYIKKIKKSIESNIRIKYSFPIHNYLIMKELERPPGSHITSYLSAEKIEKWKSAADVQAAKIMLKSIGFYE